MNQDWQRIVSLNVFYDWGKENKTEDAARKANYKLGEMIAKIVAFQSEGKVVCLFIGRTPYEKLPSDYQDEAEANEVYIAADISIISPEGHEELKDLPGIDQRVFIWMDFNQQEGLLLIKGLFDKVIIDLSTTKGLNNDFANRFAVLLRNNKSRMIFDNCNSIGMPLCPPVEQFSFDTQKYTLLVPQNQFFEKDEMLISNCYGNYILIKTQEEIQADKNFFKEEFYVSEEDPSFDVYFKSHIAKKYEQTGDNWVAEIFGQSLKSHLESRYHVVEYHRKENYPYTSHYSLRNNTDNYFVVFNYKIADN